MSQIFDTAIFDGNQPIIGNSIFDTDLKVIVVKNPIEAFIPDRTTNVEVPVVG